MGHNPDLVTSSLLLTLEDPSGDHTLSPREGTAELSAPALTHASLSKCPLAPAPHRRSPQRSREVLVWGHLTLQGSVLRAPQGSALEGCSEEARHSA